MRRMFAVLAVLAGIIAACAGFPTFGRTYIDGYPVGKKICTESPDWLCEGLRRHATSMLDAAAPGHQPIVSIDTYVADFRSKDGGIVLRSRGTAGGDSIVVTRLFDQTVRAFYVGCFAGPWGPAPSPSPEDVHCDEMQQMEGEY